MPTETPSSGDPYGDKYEILEELGKGGFGRVLKARHRILGRIVALKQLAPGLLVSEEDYERFRREARAMDQISHPNIVSVFDAGVEQGFPYIEMAFIEGPDLETVIYNEGPMPIANVVRLGLEMASALAHTHAQDIIHRDIKASNILRRDEDGQFFLTDFGTALQSNLTRITTGIMGSPEYMSPEQLAGEVVVQSDLYSLGVVLFEALTGQTPFVRSESHEAATIELMQEIRHETAPDVRALRRDVPAWLAETVARCLKKNPEARYESAEALEHALEHEESGVSKAAAPSRPTQRTVEPEASKVLATPPPPSEVPAEASTSPTLTQPSQKSQGNSRRLVWGGGVLVIFLLLAWGIGSQFSGGSSADRRQGDTIAAADTLSDTEAAEDPKPEEPDEDPTPEEDTPTEGETTVREDPDSSDANTTASEDPDEEEPPAEPEDLTTPNNIEATVDAYLYSGANDNIASVQAFYADRVDYYNEGRVGQAGVLRDKRNYMERWPARFYQRTSDVDISRLGQDVVQARFEYSFQVANSEQDVKGTGWSLLTFRQEGNRLVIIGEKGEVTSQQ